MAYARRGNVRAREKSGHCHWEGAHDSPRRADSAQPLSTLQRDRDQVGPLFLLPIVANVSPDRESLETLPAPTGSPALSRALARLLPGFDWWRNTGC